MQHLFFELLQVAIGRGDSLSRVPSADEWSALYGLSVKQAVAGVCFCGVQRLPKEQVVHLPKQLMMQWFALAEGIRQRNELMNRRCVEIQGILTRVGFRNFIMKGQGVAEIYNLNLDLNLNKDSNLGLYRQSGDIDVYVEGGYKKVMEYVNRTFPTKEVNELEIHYHCFDDAEVEIHFKPFSLRNPIMNRRLQRFFDEECEACFNNRIRMSTGGEITVPTLRFNLVHQMVHIFHHLFTEGIGLRQLMDYYFVLMAIHGTHGEHGFCDCDGDRDSEHGLYGLNGDAEAIANRWLRELGLLRFAGAVMYVEREVFGLQKEYMLCEPDEKGGRMLLKEIMQRGNFGMMSDDKIDLGNRWTSFWYVNSKTIRFARFDPWAWFWTPLTRIYYFGWRKVNGFE